MYNYLVGRYITEHQADIGVGLSAPSSNLWDLCWQYMIL